MFKNIDLVTCTNLEAFHRFPDAQICISITDFLERDTQFNSLKQVKPDTKLILEQKGIIMTIYE